jgi:hypothetical protein
MVAQRMLSAVVVTVPSTLEVAMKLELEMDSWRG